jgi:hypothetical protein
MFNTCGIQRPLYADVSDLARKLEDALDLMAGSCVRGELHPFLFYFSVLLNFTDRFVYSHFRSLDWFSISLPPFLTSGLWNDHEFVSSSLAVVRSLVTSPVALGDIDPGK